MSVREILLACVVGCTLAGCGTTNSWLARNMGDSIPHWVGGLPPDAPPRAGTQQYDEYRKKLEGEAGKAAEAKAAAQPESSASSAAIH